MLSKGYFREGQKEMNGLTVSNKIILSFAILIAILLGFGAYASYSGRMLNASTKEVMDWTVTLGAASDLSDAANIVRRRAVMRGITTDPVQRAEIERSLDEAKKDVEKAFANYEQVLSTITYTTPDGAQKDREILENERKAWQAYLETAKGLTPLMEAGDTAAVLAYIQGPTREKYRAFTKLVMEDQERSIKGAQDTMAESNVAYDRVIMTTIVVAVVAVLLAGVCGFLLLRTISASVDMVLSSLRKVAQGDLSIHLPTDSGDEFGQMAFECNKMLENIRGMTKTIQKTAESVSDSSGLLTSTSEQSALATQNVAQSITEVAEAAQTQMDSVAEAKHQVHAFTRGLTDVTKTIENVGTDIAHTSQKAEEGNKLVVATVDQMNTIADTVISSSNVVAKLGERSKEIGNIVEVISGISGQTNLLALNAAIEAARAGEHGHGFAVVAEEVRKLAEESQNASKQIGDLIHTIQEETEQAVAAMETGREEAEKGRENVTATGEEFSEIRAMIDRLKQYSVTIGTTMEDLTQRAAKIDDATGKIHDSASKVAAESQNVSAATEQQAAGMQEIAASSRSLSDMAHDLHTAAAKFKT